MWDRQPPRINFTKLQAAKKQIDTAIWLWYNDGEIASIHTLTGAAFGICDGIFHFRKMGRPVPFDPKQLSKEFWEISGWKERDARNVLLDAQDFFKHARKDPEGTHELNPFWTELYLFLTMKAYVHLMRGEKMGELMRAFSIHFALRWPELFGTSEQERLHGLLDVDAVKKLSRYDFFLMACSGFIGNPPT